MLKNILINRNNIIRLLAIIFFMLAVNTVAFSDGIKDVVDCRRTSGYYQYYASATLNLGRDVAKGDPIGDWLTTGNDGVWTCTLGTEFSQSPTVYMRAAVYVPYARSTALPSVTVNGDSYYVYLPMSISTRGYGLIYRYRYGYLGQMTSWTPVTATPVTYPYKSPNEVLTIPKDTTTSPFTINLQVQARLIKLDDKAITAANATIAAQDTLYFRNAISTTTTIPESNTTTQDSGSGYYMITRFSGGNIKIDTDPGTCTTPNVTVDLGETAASVFTGIGSTGARTSFNLNFNQCPPGYNSIGYQISPTTSILDSTQGVAAMNASSTASGLGIQLLTSEDKPIIFNNTYNLSDYDPTVTANYVVPLKAGLYQTESKVGSGSVSGTFTYTLNYK